MNSCQVRVWRPALQIQHHAVRELVWKIVDEAINDLVKNRDLIETTRRDYIVGYICEKLQRVLPISGN